MPAPSTIAVVYATDEDVAVRAPGDFAALAPESQKLAYGTDGSFDSTGWILSSATNNFQNMGIASNNVVLLTAPKSAFPGGGEDLAIDSVNGHAITLRRKNQAAGVGYPPGTGSLAGVTFKIKTLYPQLENASFEANRFFGIDPNIAGTAPGDMYDQRELRQFVVLVALQRLYASMMRTNAGDWADKLKQVSEDLANLRSMLTVRWGEIGQGQAARSIFGAQIRR